MAGFDDLAAKVRQNPEALDEQFTTAVSEVQIIDFREKMFPLLWWFARLILFSVPACLAIIVLAGCEVLHISDSVLIWVGRSLFAGMGIAGAVAGSVFAYNWGKKVLSRVTVSKKALPSR